jgi:hypothetical protein
MFMSTVVTALAAPDAPAVKDLLVDVLALGLQLSTPRSQPRISLLQASTLTAFIEQSLSEGQSKTLRAFRAWVRTDKSSITE